MRRFFIFLSFFITSSGYGLEDPSNTLNASMVCIRPHKFNMETSSSPLPALKKAKVSYLTGSELEFCYAVKYIHDYYKTALSTRNWDSDKNFIALRTILDKCQLVLYASDEW